MFSQPLGPSSLVAPIPTEAPYRDGLSRPRGQTFLDQPPSGDLEVTVDFLTEVDKLVQLIECPIFTCKSPASAAASAPLPEWGVGRALPPGVFPKQQEQKTGDDRAKESSPAGPGRVA